MIVEMDVIAPLFTIIYSYHLPKVTAIVLLVVVGSLFGQMSRSGLP
jgi:hypothetical protein